MSELLIEHRGGLRALALMEQGSLVEYLEEEPAAGPQPEAIYLGKAVRVMKALNAVFVQLAPGVEGFLPFAEIPGGGQPRPGDRLLVQVKKPPQGGKAAYLTADILFPGSLLLLLPLGKAQHVSQRVAEEQERQRLLALAAELAPEGMALVMREESLRASGEELAEELQLLLGRWREVEARAALAAPPALLAPAPDLLQQLLREQRGRLQRILTDRPELLPPLELPVISQEAPFALHQVEEQLHKAMRRRQHLRSGATLVIDPCEAMTVIDVNSAQQSARKDHVNAVMAINREAAVEIARLLRLRAIGGIVLIDFIDPHSEEEREALAGYMRELLRADPVKTVVHGFTHLNFLEMTRRRQRRALPGERLRACPQCRGSGLVEEDALEA